MTNKITEQKKNRKEHNERVPLVCSWVLSVGSPPKTKKKLMNNVGYIDGELR